MNKQDILDYIMNTPYNTNWAVVKSIVGDNKALYDYITTTPYNMNRAVLNGILDKIDGGEDEPAGSSKVGEAVVGTAIVGGN